MATLAHTAGVCIYQGEIVANPQKENGHLDLANEIVDQLCHYRISGEEYQVLWVILRKTYGWNKKEDRISISQFYSMTGMKKPSIVRALKKLHNKNIVSKKATGLGNVWSLNKDYHTWTIVSKKATPVAKELTGSSKKANTALAKKLHTKDTITKDTIQKTVAPTKQFFESVIKRDSKYEGIIQFLISRKVPEKLARLEIDKFTSYWTEPNQSGTKEHWQLEKTFEVRRRLLNWLSRVKFQPKERVGKSYD
jgi:phage replication O-like protein O